MRLRVWFPVYLVSALGWTLVAESGPISSAQSTLNGRESMVNQGGQWVSGLHVNGINNFARVMYEYNGALVVGGIFSAAGNVRANAIATYDGTTWSGLGSGVIVSVEAMTVYNDRLIVGGAISQAGGQDVNNIAAWDGESWDSLDIGVNGSVRALTVFDGDLIAAGSFTMAGGLSANAIARWDGAQWHPLGDGLSGSTTTVYALAVFDGKLVAAGFFPFSGNVPVYNIAQWDGQAWSPLGLGVTGTVRTMVVHDGELIIGGSFQAVGGIIPAQGLASWNGIAWASVPLVIGPGLSQVNALLSLNNDLFVGGLFQEVNQVPVGFMFSWDGATVNTLSGGVAGATFPEVDDFFVFQDELYVCGRFATSAGRPVYSIGVLNTEGWQPVSPGLGFDKGISAILEYNGSYMAAGDFLFTARQSATRVALLDGAGWIPLGEGLNASVRALATFDGSPIAAGLFSASGSAPLNYIASWSGTDWLPMGNGLNGPVATCLVVGDSLVVGGDFSRAGNVNANNIAVWDGCQWSPMGVGFDFPVLALAHWDGSVIAGGNFEYSGAEAASHIARWNGTTWNGLGGGVDSPVLALAKFKDNLIAGGNFSRAGGQSASAIAMWDGANWVNLGSGVVGVVNALASHNGNLFAGGFFEEAGGSRIDRIAKWDGNFWFSLGTGIRGEVFTLLSSGPDLYVGGLFGIAGQTRSSNIAIWREATTPVSLLDLSVSWANDGAQLSWIVQTDGDLPTRLRIQRSDNPDGPYDTLSDALVADSGHQTFLDSRPPQGGDLWYRICAEAETRTSCTSPVVLKERTSSQGFSSVRFVQEDMISIQFFLPETSTQADLAVYDVRGRMTRQLFRGTGNPGMNSVLWDLKTANGTRASRGIYFVRLSTTNASFTEKILVVHRGH